MKYFYLMARFTALECVSSSPEVFTNNVVNQIEKLHQCARNSETGSSESYGFIIRLLRILSRLLSKSFSIGRLIAVSHVQYLIRLMIVPNLSHEVPTIRALAILCLGQFCGLQSEISAKHVPFLFRLIDEVVSRKSVPLNSPILVPLLLSLFDALFQHASTPFVLESGSDNSKEIDFYNGLLYIYSNCPSSDGDVKETNKFSINNNFSSSSSGEESEDSDDDEDEEEDGKDEDGDVVLIKRKKKGGHRRRHHSKKYKKTKRMSSGEEINICGYEGGLRTLIVEGLCKLLVRNRILGPVVRKHVILFLLLISFSPETEKYTKIKQILNSFFQVYPSSVDEQRDVAEIFVTSLRYILLATGENPFSEIPILRNKVNPGFGMFVLELTNPEWFKKKKKVVEETPEKNNNNQEDEEEEEGDGDEGENHHNEMILDLVREIISKDNTQKNMRKLCRLLPHFQINGLVHRELYFGLSLVAKELSHKTCEKIVNDLRKEIEESYVPKNKRMRDENEKKNKKKNKKKNSKNSEEEEEEEGETEEEVEEKDLVMSKKEEKDFGRLQRDFEEERFDFIMANPKMDEFYIHPEDDDESEDDDDDELEEEVDDDGVRILKKKDRMKTGGDDEDEFDDDEIFDKDIVTTPQVLRIQDRRRRKLEKKKKKRLRKKKRRQEKEEARKKQRRKGKLRRKSDKFVKKGKKRKRGKEYNGTKKEVEEGDIDELLNEKKKRRVMSSKDHMEFEKGIIGGEEEEEEVMEDDEEVDVFLESGDENDDLELED